MCLTSLRPRARSPWPPASCGWIAGTLALALSGGGKKGEVRAVAEIAGVMAAKKTAELIPLYHPLSLTKVVVQVTADAGGAGLAVMAEVKTTGPTGVEMEALTAVSVACLTLYDMLKAADKGMTIKDVRLVSKTGGASGDYQRARTREGPFRRKGGAGADAGAGRPWWAGETLAIEAALGRVLDGPRHYRARPARRSNSRPWTAGRWPGPGEAFRHRRRERRRPCLSYAAITPGDAVRIFTGAPVPQGRDPGGGAGRGRAREGDAG